MAGVLLGLGGSLGGAGSAVPCCSPSLSVSAPLPLEFGQRSSREAVRPAVTFAFSFCIREAGRWGEGVLRSP